MLKSSLKSFLILLVLATSANAKEFFVGFNGHMDNSYFNSNVQVIKIYKTLDIALVEADKISDLAYLKLDPNISFVEESITFDAPKKFISKPIYNFTKKMKAPRQVVKPVGISLVNADKAWKETQGEGIRVLVLDSGIDKNHPALIANFEKGRNFISGAPSNDFSDENGHGTHVAGTIAATGPLLGVAPKVKILSAKVCNTGCPSVAILDGVEWGIKERVDVMNLSLGGPFASSFARRVYQKAEQNNIVVVAASGNDGKDTDSYPASYNEVLSVGAVDANLMIASFSNWSINLDVVAPGVKVYSAVPQGTGRMASAKVNYDKGALKLNISPMTGSGVDYLKDLEIVYTGLGKVSDYSTLDVKGKIALIKRGELTFKEKLDNAVAEGAVGIIVFNNTEEPLNGTLGDDENSKFIAVTLDKEAGEKIVELLKTQTLTASLAVEATDYQDNNGTSMASPHVAGVAALIRAQNPKLTATEVKELIKKTATATTNPSPEKYGMGLVNAAKAVEKARSL